MKFLPFLISKLITAVCSAVRSVGRGKYAPAGAYGTLVATLVFFVPFFSVSAADSWVLPDEDCDLGYIGLMNCQDLWNGATANAQLIQGGGEGVMPYAGDKMVCAGYCESYGAQGVSGRLFFDASPKGFIDGFFSMPSGAFSSDLYLRFGYNYPFGTNLPSDSELGLVGDLRIYKDLSDDIEVWGVKDIAVNYEAFSPGSIQNGKWIYWAFSWDFTAENAVDKWVRYNVGGIWGEKIYNPFPATRSPYGVGAVSFYTGSQYSTAYLDSINYYPNSIVSAIDPGVHFVVPADGSVQYFNDWVIDLNSPPFDYSEIQICYGDTPSAASDCSQFEENLILQECDNSESPSMGRYYLPLTEELEEGQNYYAKVNIIAGSDYDNGVCATSTKVSDFTTFQNTNNPLYVEKPWYDRLIDSFGSLDFEISWDSFFTALQGVYTPTGGWESSLSEAKDEFSAILGLQFPFCYFYEFGGCMTDVSLSSFSDYLFDFSVNVPTGLGDFPLTIQAFDTKEGSDFKEMMDSVRPYINIVLWVSYVSSLAVYSYHYLTKHV